MGRYTAEELRVRSEQAKRQWQDPEFRQKVLAAVTKHGRNATRAAKRRGFPDELLVECLECGKRLARIHRGHLRVHGMTLEEYQQKHPGSPLFSDAYDQERREKIRRTWDDPTVRRRIVESQREGRADPEAQKRNLEVRSQPEYRNHLSEAIRASWRNPDVRDKKMGVFRSEEFRSKIAEISERKMAEIQANWEQTPPGKRIPTTSGPHRRLKAVLEERRLSFASNKRVGPFCPDEVCQDRKIAIEVDGCFWHGCPDHASKDLSPRQEKQRKHDAEEGRYMEKNGWKLLRFWEHDIKRDLAGCVLKVQEVM